MRTRDMAALGILGGAFMLGKWLERRRNRLRQPKDPLDHPLLWFNRDDCLTVREFLGGGVAIMGMTGSGKSSSSGKALAQAILGYPKSGMLILCAKPED